jgi:hypothetical protein
LYFKGLDQVVESKNAEIINFVGIVLKVGSVGAITLKRGDQKQRRNILLCDESNMTVVACFWSEKYGGELDNVEKKVIAIVGGRVSEYSGKSINVSEDSRVFVEPIGFERTSQLQHWWH